MLSNQITLKSAKLLLILRYSQTKDIIILVSYLFLKHIFGTIYPISLGFSAKCRVALNLSTFRLILFDHSMHLWKDVIMCQESATSPEEDAQSACAAYNDLWL